jgi:hypothetical protein
MAKYKETALNYEALPAKGKYPALILASGVEEQVPHPVQARIHRHIRGDRHGQSVASTLLCEVFVLVLRFQRVLLVQGWEWPPLDRIGISLHRTVTWALGLTLRKELVYAPPVSLKG